MAGGTHLETEEGHLRRLAADDGRRDNGPPRLKSGRWADATMSRVPLGGLCRVRLEAQAKIDTAHERGRQGALRIAIGGNGQRRHVRRSYVMAVFGVT